MDRRTRIKICGVMRSEDARVAADAGADAIGMVFHPSSPRYVSPAQALAIVEQLPPFVAGVGLFVNADLGTIRQTMRTVPIAAIQLHGDETPELIDALRPIPVIKALRVDPAIFSQTLARWRSAVVELHLKHLVGMVLETANTREPGGSGVANDWQTVAKHQRAGQFAGLPPIIAAGGLTPETVGDVVRDLRPWAVDVSSGVETAKGEKSAEKMRRFVSEVRCADGDSR